jgi:peptidoglycan/LPS O-acetylase OafA/YrhL
VDGKTTDRRAARHSLSGLPTLLFAGLTVVLVLIPLLGPIMLPTWGAIAAAVAAAVLLYGMGRLPG